MNTIETMRCLAAASLDIETSWHMTGCSLRNQFHCCLSSGKVYN